MNTLNRWQRSDLAALPGVGRIFGLRSDLDSLFAGISEWPVASQLFGGGTPAMDVLQDKDNVYVKAELPGMKKEEIDVSLHDGVLSISGERKTGEKHKDAETYRAERYVGRFHRALTLPAQVKADAVKANYKDGILTITLPKAEEAKPKQVEIKVN